MIILHCNLMAMTLIGLSHTKHINNADHSGTWYVIRIDALNIITCCCKSVGQAGNI